MSPEILKRKKIKAKKSKIGMVSSIILYFSIFWNFPYEISVLDDEINERSIIKYNKLKKWILNLFKIIKNFY